MYSFVAGAGLSPAAHLRGMSVAQMLRQAAEQVAAQAPDLGTSLRVSCTELPEIDGGWAAISPTTGARPSVVSQFCSDDHAALVFGQVYMRGEAAECVCTNFSQGGIDEVANLPGAFSAVIVDRRSRRLHVYTSIPGWRSLRYRMEADALYLSPIDLGIVALSRCVVRPSLETLATVVACGWTLGGGSALDGVYECQSDERWTWDAGRFQMARASFLDPRNRVPMGDIQAVSRQTDAIIEELVQGARHQLTHYEGQTIAVPLTAGMDSRAVLALLHPWVAPGTLETYTRGAENNDMRVAREISRRLHLKHNVRKNHLPSSDVFISNARFIAMLTNGSGNADAAVVPALRVESSPPLPLGYGPEVLRGLYYKYLWRAPKRASGARRVAGGLLAGPLSRLRNTSFADDALTAEPSKRLLQAVARLEVHSTNEHDLADLFFLCERMGRWEGMEWRHHLGPALVPFTNHRALLSAFMLPAPIGHHAILAKVIARYIPEATWLPINGAGLLALEGPGSGRFIAREVLRVTAKAVGQVRQRWSRSGGNPKDAQREHLRGSLSEAVQDTLRSASSFSRTLFTRSQRDAIFGSHLIRPSETLAGAVLSLDFWKASLDVVLQSNSSPRV